MPFIAAAVVGSAYVSSRASKKSAESSERVADRSFELEREQYAKQLAFEREQFSYNQQMDQFNMAQATKVQATADRVANAQLADMETARGRATNMWDYYQSVGRPAVTKAMDEANDWDSEDTMQEMRGQAGTDVERGFGQQREALVRNMGRMGVNPASGRMMATMGAQGADAALAKVNAANMMTENRRTQGANMRVNAANMANGFQGQSTAQSQLGLGFGNAAVGNQTSAFGTGIAVQGATNAGMANASNTLYGAGRTLHNANTSAMSNQAYVNGLNMQTANSYGQMLGGMAMGAMGPQGYNQALGIR